MRCTFSQPSLTLPASAVGVNSNVRPHIKQRSRRNVSVKNLRTEAWLLRGISSIPGELRLAAGTLSFTCSGFGSAWPFQLRKLGTLLDRPSLATTLEEGGPFLLFKWPASEVLTTVPWYYFGGGIKLKHQGVQLRFSFGRPASGGHNLAAASAQIKEVGVMRSKGKLWSQALSSTSPPSSGEA